jgi:hypothetical protein
MTSCEVLPRLYDALSLVCDVGVSGLDVSGGAGVTPIVSWVVVSALDTVSEPEEPPQPTRGSDEKQRQVTATTAFVEEVRMKIAALEKVAMLPRDLVCWSVR